MFQSSDILREYINEGGNGCGSSSNRTTEQAQCALFNYNTYCENVQNLTHNPIIIHTDGSHDNHKSGAGIVLKSDILDVNTALCVGPHNILIAELWAILAALIITNTFFPDEILILFTDSLDSFNHIYNHHTKTLTKTSPTIKSLVYQIRAELNPLLHLINRISGHVNIPGNDEADIYANQGRTLYENGTLTPSTDPFHVRNFSLSFLKLPSYHWCGKLQFIYELTKWHPPLVVA